MINKESLLKAKNLINSKIQHNKELIKAINKLKQDEIILDNENKTYKTILDVLNKEIQQEQLKQMSVINDNQSNNERIQDITKKIS